MAGSEPCLWRYEDPVNHDLLALAVVHVDDFLIAGRHGNSEFQRLRQAMLDLYKWQPWESGKFEQCGVWLEQFEDFSFTLLQDKFTHKVAPLHISRPRRNTPNATATEAEQSSI